MLENWASSATVGQETERRRFVRTHMTETDNIVEILLRLVRGERRGPPIPYHTTDIPPKLLAALPPGAAVEGHHTCVSLAVLSLFRMTVGWAIQAEGDKGKARAEESVGELIRSMPSHLIFATLDRMFEDWKAEKKGG